MPKIYNRGRYKMKKIISLFLAAVMVFSVSSVSFAAADECDCGVTPVVYVQGFGEALYENVDTEDEISAFPPEAPAILKAIPDILKALGVAAIAGDYEGFGDYAMRGVNKILGLLACDKEGNSLYNVSFEPDDNIGTAEQHMIPCSPFSDNAGDYSFIYDWRLDPIYNAELLKDFIDEVKELTGHKKVSLVAHSQGNTIVASYLEKFGSDDVEKIAFLSPAFKGLSLMGSLFANEASIRDKGEEFAELVKGAMGFDPLGDMLSSLIHILNDVGIAKGLLNWAQNVLDDQLERILQEGLCDVFGTMPGLWTFVPDEYYEKAKETMFTDKEKYSVLIEKIDYYHYNVQNELENIIQDAMDNGVDVTISMGYGLSTIPVPVTDPEQADMLIDVEYMSIGATCASPFGTVFDKDYVQAEYCSGHNHVSPDMMIDASTCEFPEITWFVREQTHSEFADGYAEFLEWVLLYDGQPTVHSNEKYPQFMTLTEDGTLEPVEGLKPVDNRGHVVIFFSSIFEMIKNSFKK